LIQILSEEGTSTATQLAADLPITRQGVTKHLAILVEADLVVARQHGRERRYSLTPEPLDEALGWIEAIGAAWDQRLESLRKLLDEDA